MMDQMKKMTEDTKLWKNWLEKQGGPISDNALGM